MMDKRRAKTAGLALQNAINLVECKQRLRKQLHSLLAFGGNITRTPNSNVHNNEDSTVLGTTLHCFRHLVTNKALLGSKTVGRMT